MSKRRSVASPPAASETPETPQETPTDGDSSKRRRVAPSSPSPSPSRPQTHDDALETLNRTLVALLSEQLLTHRCGDWTALLAQYHVRLQEIRSAFGFSREAEQASMRLSLPSVVDEKLAHDGHSDQKEEQEEQEKEYATTGSSTPTVSPQPPSVVEPAEEEEPAQPIASQLQDDLPESPNPFAGGFSHSIPLDEDEDDGFSDTPVEFTTTRDGDDELMAQTSLSFGMDCFLPVQRSFGIWNEPELLKRRIPSDQLQVAKQISTGNFGDVFLSELSGQRVAAPVSVRPEQGDGTGVCE